MSEKNPFSLGEDPRFVDQKTSLAEPLCGLIEEKDGIIPDGYRVEGVLISKVQEKKQLFVVADDHDFVPNNPQAAYLPENPNIPEEFKAKLMDLGEGTDGVLFVQKGSANLEDLRHLTVPKGVNLKIAFVFDIDKIKIAWKPAEISGKPEEEATSLFRTLTGEGLIPDGFYPVGTLYPAKTGIGPKKRLLISADWIFKDEPEPL